MDAPDYYAYAPLVTLERPVALAGLPGSNPMQTARVATMVTGLQATLLPNEVAHRLGMEVEGLLVLERDDELHAAELELIERALAERSPRVLALGPTTLDDPRCRAALREVQLVHLEQTIPEAMDNLQRDMVEDPRRHQHLKRYGAISESNLRPLFLKRTRQLQDVAEISMRLAGRRPLSVGRALPELLGW